MIEQKSESMISRVVFALFFLLVVSLGLMKPGVFVSVATLTPTDLVFPFLFAAWLVAIATRQMRFVWHPAFLALAVYFLAFAVSAVFSTRPRASFAKLAGELYLVLLPVVTVSVVESIARLKQTVSVWIIGSAIPILVGLFGIALFYVAPDAALLQEITYHYGSVPVGNFPRISSTFITASMFCNYLTATLAILAGAWSMNWLNKRTAVVLLFAMAVCTMFTVSIAIGGAVLAVGLLIWRLTPPSSRRTAGLVTAILVAIAFLLVSPIDLAPRPASHYSVSTPLPGSLSPSPRLVVWEDAASRLIDKPVVGSGIGTPSAEVIFVNTDGSRSLLTDAHNTFLNVAAQCGLIGLAGLLFVIWSVVKAGFRTRSAELGNIQTALFIAFVAAFLYDGLTGSFEDARHLWVLIGLILAVDGIDGEGSSLGDSSRA